MPDAPNILNINLFHTTLRDFTVHFISSFCRPNTFKTRMPEISWVNKTYEPYDFEWEYDEYKKTDPNRYPGNGINFQMYDYKWEGKPFVPFVLWEVRGYGSKHYRVRQIYHTLSVTRYRTDQLRVILEEGKRSNDGQHYDDGLFVSVLLDWIEIRWGTETKGYERLQSMITPRPILERLTQAQLEVADLTADGLTQKEIASRLIKSVPTIKTFKRQIRERLGIEGGNLRSALRQRGYGTGVR